MKKREARSWKIIVPASTANLGAGFDSLGLALDLFLTVEAAELQKVLQKRTEKRSSHVIYM
jgi:homoserine kinase